MENACISHSYSGKPWHLPYNDGKIIFSLLIELDVYKISTVKTGEKKMRRNKMNLQRCPSPSGKFSVLSRFEPTAPNKQSNMETYLLETCLPVVLSHTAVDLSESRHDVGKSLSKSNARIHLYKICIS